MKIARHRTERGPVLAVVEEEDVLSYEARPPLRPGDVVTTHAEELGGTCSTIVSGAAAREIPAWRNG